MSQAWEIPKDPDAIFDYVSRYLWRFRDDCDSQLSGEYFLVAGVRETKPDDTPQVWIRSMSTPCSGDKSWDKCWAMNIFRFKPSVVERVRIIPGMEEIPQG